jgi:hypothetical protein
MRITQESEQLALQPSPLLPADVEARIYTPEEVFEIDPDKRLTFPRFLTEVSRALPEAYCDEEAYESARPQAIERGLLIPKGDPRRIENPVNLVVTDGGYEIKPIGYKFSPGLGVVFEPEIFRVVARSPGDLAKWAKSETLKSIKKNQSAEDMPKTAEEMALQKKAEEHKAIRSAVHTLDTKIIAIDSLSAVLSEDRSLLGRLYRALLPSTRVHFKAKNLSKYREILDERIHDTTDLAAKNLSWDAFALPGIHRAIYNNLYNQPHKQRVANAKGYVTLLGKHCRAKHEKTLLSRHATVQVRDEHMEMLPERMQEVIQEEYSPAYS